LNNLNYKNRGIIYNLQNINKFFILLYNMVKDAPLSEITLRKYEKPYDLDERQLIKKICLSLGLLQPGDGRDVIVDVLNVLINERKKRGKLSSDEVKNKVEEFRKRSNLELKGLAESNIRRQLKRLRDFMIIEKENNRYFLSEFAPLSSIFEEKIERFYINSHIERVKEYLRELDK